MTQPKSSSRVIRIYLIKKIKAKKTIGLKISEKTKCQTMRYSGLSADFFISEEKCRFLSKNFDFWAKILIFEQKFWFLSKNFDFWENILIFDEKCRFLSLANIRYFAQNKKFEQKFWFFFVKTPNLDGKFKFR